MTTGAGQAWIDGRLDAEAYFREARKKARRLARHRIAARLRANNGHDDVPKSRKSGRTSRSVRWFFGRRCADDAGRRSPGYGR